MTNTFMAYNVLVTKIDIHKQNLLKHCWWMRIYVWLIIMWKIEKINHEFDDNDGHTHMVHMNYSLCYSPEAMYLCFD